jgi:cytochrome c biogenesis protein CcdA
MRKLFQFVLAVLLIFSVSASGVDVYEFGRTTCPHCIAVMDSGILEEVNSIEGVNVNSYLLEDKESLDLFYEFRGKLGFEGIIPTVVIQCGDEYAYLQGDSPIINNLKEYSVNCEKYARPAVHPIEPNPSERFSLYGVIFAALIDSINPCAFGVLIFLMISLLNLGSRKRALRYGIFYSLIIFITYFLAGLGIFKFLQQFTGIRETIYLVVGIFVLILGVMEFFDYLNAKKGREARLKISSKIKPLIEEKAKKGTVFAILALGVLVALFELPCTGGIYLGIISLILESETMGMIYLLIYNFIFILPLLVLTFLVYKGMSPERLQKWNSSEKAGMRLFASIALLIIGAILVYFSLG